MIMFYTWGLSWLNYKFYELCGLFTTTKKTFIGGHFLPPKVELVGVISDNFAIPSKGIVAKIQSF